MKFYNRKKELARLGKIEKMSQDSPQMTFVVGRRRIGKTSLLIKAYESRPFVYFFVAKKNEALLCAEYVEEIQHKLEVPVFGEIKTFKAVFGFLMELSKTKHFTLIIDEFQEFMTVNPSVYSDMQHSWDRNKQDSKINLIVCGSVYSMMTRIFEHSKEPLFGRATQRIHVQAFPITTLKKILNDYFPEYSQEDLLAFYMVTGGVAKYVELLVQARAFTLETILDEVFNENSLFLEEGKNVLIDEFGKEYGNYFSILSLIASGKTARVEIESIMEMHTGGFLDRLENQYGLVTKIRPILAKPNSRSVKYKVNDNFLRFWFRFIYKYRNTVEAGNLQYLKETVKKDYTTFSGLIIEKYFIQKLILEKSYTTIGTYWEKNNHNEIDIVAVNEQEKEVLFAEVKRQKKKINVKTLQEKSEKLQVRFQEYKLLYKGFSLEDM
ncbi:MAG TPA: ATP-binding protein [Pelobium sp.]|nr:ATP-binding protein [Pelobium sp.]